MIGTDHLMRGTWYPKAVKSTALDDELHQREGLITDRNQVTLHITEGTTAAGAISTFASSRRVEDGGHGLTSAHFVVERNGVVYQLAPLENSTWHASQVNLHSVGIETVALSMKGAADLNKQYLSQIAAGKQLPWTFMPATPAQIASLADLLVWISAELKMPIDRAHIRTHNEASPRDGHVQCCTGALNPDVLVINAAAKKAAA